MQRKPRSYGPLSAWEHTLLLATKEHRITGHTEGEMVRYRYVLHDGMNRPKIITSQVNRLVCMGMLVITYHSKTRASVTLSELGRKECLIRN